jgi:predicted nucleic acid-binding protein
LVIVADSGAVYALYDADDAHHGAVRRAMAAIRESLHIPMACLGEIDYLLRERLGLAAELDFLAEIRRGRFILEPLTLADIPVCTKLIEQYAELELGLADAAVVATAERLKTTRIFTVDQRDFHVLRSVKGERFTVIPFSAGSVAPKSKSQRRTR